MITAHITIHIYVPHQFTCHHVYYHYLPSYVCCWFLTLVITVYILFPPFTFMPLPVPFPSPFATVTYPDSVTFVPHPAFSACRFLTVIGHSPLPSSPPFVLLDSHLFPNHPHYTFVGSLFVLAVLLPPVVTFTLRLRLLIYYLRSHVCCLWLPFPRLHCRYVGWFLSGCCRDIRLLRSPYVLLPSAVVVAFPLLRSLPRYTFFVVAPFTLLRALIPRWLFVAFTLPPFPCSSVYYRLLPRFTTFIVFPATPRLFSLTLALRYVYYYLRSPFACGSRLIHVLRLHCGCTVCSPCCWFVASSPRSPFVTVGSLPPFARVRCVGYVPVDCPSTLFYWFFPHPCALTFLY